MIKNNLSIFPITDYSMQNNSYILIQNNDVVIIDPSFNGKKIKNFIENINKTQLQNQINVKGIILTHAHYDHLIDAFKISSLYNCSIFCYKDEKNILFNHNLSSLFGEKIQIDQTKIIFYQNTKLILGKINLEILHTPGHTIGSVCIYADGNLFTGDTLFADSIGRTDFYSGSLSDLKESIKKIINNFPKETIIYPGHNKPKVLFEILEENTYVKEILK